MTRAIRIHLILAALCFLMVASGVVRGITQPDQRVVQVDFHATLEEGS